MTVLLWVAVLVVVWFAASLVVALVVGRYLRRCSAGIECSGDPDAARPLDTGPLRIWLADLPRVPAPREHQDQAATATR